MPAILTDNTPKNSIPLETLPSGHFAVITADTLAAGSHPESSWVGDIVYRVPGHVGLFALVNKGLYIKFDPNVHKLHVRPLENGETLTITGQ